MGLVFALQPDLRKTTPSKLVLKSSKRKFGLGGGFIFGGALLGTMYLAAAPLFKVFWSEGTLFDQSITLAIQVSIFAYPIVALACWFFEEVVCVERDSNASTVSVVAYETLLGLKWKKRFLKNLTLDQFTVDNWKGAVNVAAIEQNEQGQTSRYATRGHWILRAGRERVSLERRAKKDDIDVLLSIIQQHFQTNSGT